MPVASARLGSACALVLAVACVPASDDAGATAATSSASSASMSASSASTDDTETADSSDADCTLTLLDHQAWTALDAELDPLADHRPDPIECSIAGWYVENDKLEVDTFACNYVALTQPLLEDVEVGDTLALGLYHFDLLAPEPAVAHVAILIDGTIVWQREIEIPGGQMPGPAQVYDETFASPIAAPAGAPLVLHLHNHGQNTWTFDSLTRC